VSRVIESEPFRRSAQLKKLLIYLRDASTIDDETQISETAIGTNVFQRRDFNPKLDTIVRTEMVRLRRKLDEYYAGSGSSDPFRVSIGKNTYTISLVPKSTPVPPAVVESQPERRLNGRFWIGVAIGIGVSLLCFTAWMLLGHPRTGSAPVADNVVSHSLWSGFRATEVQVLEGSPLFFKTNRGYERNWRLNFPQDAANARNKLANWPAIPAWDKWVPFDDLKGALILDRFLGQLNSSVNLVPARERSAGSLTGHHTIILGHPRFAPVVAELLAGLNFHAPMEARSLSGFVNANPKPGELNLYFEKPAPIDDDQRDSFLINQVDESKLDFGLITSIRLDPGGEVLSIFGDRTESVAFLLERLIDPSFLRLLDQKVFTNQAQRYRSAQIVVRIDYSRGGQPAAVEYLTSRVRY
jgi:hypothetical protein